MCSVVACDRYSDWSVHASSDGLAVEERTGGKGWRGEFGRDKDSLWVLMDGELVRQVRWTFVDDDDDDDDVEDAEMWVGVMVARPADKEDGLEVGFGDLVVEIGG